MINISTKLYFSWFRKILYLELCDDGIALYKKPTNTGLYVNYNSNVAWAFKVVWIKNLTTRAKNICSPVYLKSELESIKKPSNNHLVLFTILWDKSVELANSCVKKITHYRKKDINIKFKFHYDTMKLEYFCINKDKTHFSIIRT